MRRAFALALALAVTSATLVAACGASAPSPSSPPSNSPVGLVEPPVAMAGSYSAPHTVMMVCEGGDDGWCEESVADTMTVTEHGRDRLDVSIELVQTNAHTCTFAGTLTLDPASSARRWTHHSVDELDGTCDLSLEQSGAELRLQSEGCRYYCGARASLDATFPYPPG
ncbi:MAG TPA: hypothetical protein VM261_12920 [Kofleriaceae bacterium]|nr:hypothetical protein [Kofleriaceae bacterium]